jgi:hypothetical protein
MLTTFRFALVPSYEFDCSGIVLVIRCVCNASAHRSTRIFELIVERDCYIVIVEFLFETHLIIPPLPEVRPCGFLVKHIESER